MFFITILHIFLLSPCAASVRVFDFGGARSAPPGSPLSSATLINGQEERLTDRFVVCFSTKLTKLDEKSPFVLYGENNAPWLAFSFWSEGTGLWAELQGKWLNFHILEKPWTHVWIHICADVDTVSGNISVFVEGRKPTTKNSERLKTNRPEYL